MATTTSSSGSFNNRLGFGTKPALLLIDICAAYFTPGSPLYLAPDQPTSSPTTTNLLPTLRHLLTTARESSIPIIWTTLSYRAGEAGMHEAGLFYTKASMLNLWQENDPRGLSSWMEGLIPFEGETVIIKKFASSFFETSLKEVLVKMGIDTLIIGGVSTSGCVRASVVDALQNGFRAMVVAEACGDRTEEIQRVNLADMDAKYADVVQVEDAVEAMVRAWS